MIVSQQLELLLLLLLLLFIIVIIIFVGQHIVQNFHFLFLFFFAISDVTASCFTLLSFPVFCCCCCCFIIIIIFMHPTFLHKKTICLVEHLITFPGTSKFLQCINRFFGNAMVLSSLCLTYLHNILNPSDQEVSKVECPQLF